MKAKALYLLLAAALLSTVALAAVQAASNPLAKYVTDGKISIPGGQMTAELQQLLFPPPASKTYMTFAVKTSSYPTLAFVGTSHDIPQVIRTNTVQVGHSFVLPDFVGMFRQAASAFFNLFTMNGAAAGCTGTGDCYWVGGGGNFSDVNHWATATGGAVTGGLPAATDTVHFDASSGAGTATQDVASFSSGAVTMVGSSVVVDGSSNTWTVHGAFTDNFFGKFARSTSTIVLATTATFQSNDYVYNITIDTGVTTTLNGQLFVESVLTVNGTLTPSAFQDVQLWATVANPLVLGVAGNVSTILMRFGVSSAAVTLAAYNVPGATYGGLTISTQRVAGSTATLQGNISAAVQGFSTSYQTGPITILAGTFNITTGAQNLTLGAGGLAGSITGTGNYTCGYLNLDSGSFISKPSGTFTESTFGVDISVTSYLVMGSGDWYFAGYFANLSTSLSWNVGTSTTHFNDSVAQTISGPSLKFYNLEMSGVGEKDITDDFSSNNMTAASGAPVVAITAGKTWTFTGTRIGNAAMTLESSAAGMPWNIVAGGSVIAYYVTVSDSDASGGSAILARYSNDGGGNTDWIFSNGGGGGAGGVQSPPSTTPPAAQQPSAPSDTVLLVRAFSTSAAVVSGAVVVLGRLAHLGLGRVSKAFLVAGGLSLLVLAATFFAAV